MSPQQSEGTKSPAALALEIYELLNPYSSELRQRAIQGALASLGESPAAAVPAPPTDTGHDHGGGIGGLALGPKAARWARKHGITGEMLDEVFHMDDGQKDVIASDLPAATKREKTAECYLLLGIRSLLRDDVPTIDDPEAIALCKRLAAYDKTNHSTNRSTIGNKMSGKKPSFSLTGPGEAAAADLIKKITKATA